MSGKRYDIFDYIEMFYNSKCWHDSSNQMSPTEYENRYYQRLGSVQIIRGDSHAISPQDSQPDGYTNKRQAGNLNDKERSDQRQNRFIIMVTDTTASYVNVRSKQTYPTNCILNLYYQSLAIQPKTLS